MMHECLGRTEHLKNSYSIIVYTYPESKYTSEFKRIWDQKFLTDDNGAFVFFPNQSLRTTWPSLTRRQLRGEESLTKSEGTDFRSGSNRFGKVSNLKEFQDWEDTSRCGLCLSINWISQESYERVQSSVGLGSVSLLNQISQRTRNNLGGFQDKWEPVMLKKLIQLR